MSLLKSLAGPLAGVAGSLIPGVGPIVGPLIGSAVGNALGKVGTGATGPEKAALGNAANVQNAGMGVGTNLLNMGTNAVSQPLNYYSSILSGNKGLMTSALAPEISQIGQGYQTAANTSAALNPRGGPGVDFLSQLPWAQQRDVSTLLQQARPAAAGALTGAGNNILGTGLNSLYASTAAGRDILNQQEEMLRRQQQSALGIGKGVFAQGQGQGGQAATDLMSKIAGLFRGKGGGFNQGSINLGDPGTATTPPFQGLLGNGIGLNG